MNPKPFLKWAGGKTQLLPNLIARAPQELKNGTITRYIEPFVGGGAFFFAIASQFHVPHIILLDRNPDLIAAYRTIREQVSVLIDSLRDISNQYHQLPKSQQESFFYEQRKAFNALPTGELEKTALLIFLNRTCYNGLYRVNSKGGFNVPFGRYKNPTICDADNLRAVSNALQNAEIIHGDFEQIETQTDAQTFVYFDPPYRPLSKTASFNSYAKSAFNDDEQRRLVASFGRMDKRGAKLMLSNSDPHNTDPDDDFFDVLYAGFHIDRVQARRNINSKGGKRGAITELLITNYAAA